MPKYLFMIAGGLCLSCLSFADCGGQELEKNAKNIAAICEKIPPRCFTQDEFNAARADKSPNIPESALKSLTEGEADIFVMARLAYAETLASNCFDVSNTKDSVSSPLSEDEKLLVDGISQVIVNRYNEKEKKKSSSAREIVFEKAQFRSSTGDCDVARRNEFLCPQVESDLWGYVVSSVKQKIGKSDGKLSGAKNYFFYKHFQKSKDSCAKWNGVKPSFVNKKSEVPYQSGRIKDCVSFHKL